jgi:hypothetical protein
MPEMVTGMRWQALRRQSLVALAVVADIVAESATSGSSDIDWNLVTVVSVVLALLCLSPAALASTPRSYRIGAVVVALLLTIAAVHGIVAGVLYAIPAAVLAWLTTLPIRRARID